VSISVDLQDTNCFVLDHINGENKKELDMMKNLGFLGPDSMLSKEPLKTLKLLELPSTRLRLTFSDEFETFEATCDGLEVLVLPGQHPLAHLKVSGIKTVSNQAESEGSVESVWVSAKPIRNTLADFLIYLDHFLEKSVLRVWEKSQMIQNALKRVQIESPRTVSVPKTHESSSNGSVFLIKKFDLVLSDLINKISAKISGFRSENGVTKISEVIVVDSYETETILTNPLIKTTQIHFVNNNLNLSEMSVDLTEVSLSRVSTLADNIVENTKMFSPTLERMSKQMAQLTRRYARDPSQVSVSQSHQRKQSSYTDGFVHLEDKSLTFAAFNATFKKDAFGNRSFEYLLEQTTAWKEKQELKPTIKYSFYVDSVHVRMRDEESDLDLILKLRTLFCHYTPDFMMFLLDSIQIDLEKTQSLSSLVKNSERDFAIKFYLEFAESNRINFYFRPSSFSLNSDARFADFVDQKIRKFLGWFANSEAAPDTAVNNSDGSLDVVGDEENVFVNEGLVEEFRLVVKLDSMSDKLTFRMRESNSNSIPKKDILMSEFCELIVMNINRSFTEFIRELAFVNKAKLIARLFEHIFRFIFIKKNFKRVNRAFARAVTGRPK
jgi:hypothetical protein